MQINFRDLPYRIQVLLMKEHAERVLRQDDMFREMEYEFGEQHNQVGVSVRLAPMGYKTSK